MILLKQTKIKFIKKCIVFFLYIYKITRVTKETYEANGIEVITDESGKLWSNETHVQEQLGVKNLPALTNHYLKNIKSKDLN